MKMEIPAVQQFAYHISMYYIVLLQYHRADMEQHIQIVLVSQSLTAKPCHYAGTHSNNVKLRHTSDTIVCAEWDVKLCSLYTCTAQLQADSQYTKYVKHNSDGCEQLTKPPSTDGTEHTNSTEHTMIKIGQTMFTGHNPTSNKNLSSWQLHSHWHCSIIAFGQQTSLFTWLQIKCF